MSFYQTVVCCQCNERFGMTYELFRTAMARGEQFVWYCPHGHSQVFAKGESDAEKLRRERDRLLQRVAERDDEVRRQKELRASAERRVSAARGQITRLKNRAAAGVCPCCNRSFTNLLRHMHSQHPGFVAEPDATEHVR